MDMRSMVAGWTRLATGGYWMVCVREDGYVWCETVHWLPGGVVPDGY